MAIADRDRRILWARAHNRCAICKSRLVVDATVSDAESVVGDEAHIVAQSPGGPRAGLIPGSELDRYENLILLCKVDHKVVDDQPATYTVDRLRAIKAQHEAWADAKFSDEFDLPATKRVVVGQVPVTEDEVNYAIAYRPWGWEYIQFVGALQIGLQDIAVRKDSKQRDRAISRQR
jgi:hypothetical protein